MGWGDDFLSGIQSKVQDVAANVVQSSGQWIDSKVSSGLIKIGVAPSGNLSAEELANGQRPPSPSITPSTQDPSLLARASASISNIDFKAYLPMIAIGGVVLVLLLRRK